MNLQVYAKWNDSSISDEEWIEKSFENQDGLIHQIYKIESQRINELEEIDQEEQYEQLGHIIKEYHKLELLEMERQKRLFHKFLLEYGVKALECSYTSEQLKDLWKANFAKLLSIQQRKDCYLNEHLWHAFSYEFITNYKIGEPAKTAFNQCKKSGFYMFDEDEKSYHLFAPDSLNATMLRLIYGTDTYFMADDFSWTFILKHEEMNEPIWFEPFGT